MSRTQKSYDAAILGLGSMGTFACLEIARRKASVIGFDRLAPPHDRGSHSGDTRVYREAYGEHPGYVPIARRAGELWERLGEEAGTVFLRRCGMLNIGSGDDSLIAGIRKSVALHRLEVEELRVSEIAARFPAFTPPPGSIGIFEPSAGWVDVNASMKFGLRRAKELGAEIRLHASVEGWEPEGRRIRILTSEGPVVAERLVITAGAWACRVLSDLRLPLRVLRKVLVWVDPCTPGLFRPDFFPIFAFSERFFYGFPNIDGKGVKFAIHGDPDAPMTDGDILQPAPQPSEIEPALRMAAELLPGLAGPLPGAFSRVVDAKTCLYTMTPDENFIVDRHPSLENVWIAAGFSGHGFKFAPAIGETLAELALSGKAALPVGFLSLSGRFPKPQS